MFQPLSLIRGLKIRNMTRLAMRNNALSCHCISVASPGRVRPDTHQICYETACSAYKHCFSVFPGVIHASRLYMWKYAALWGRDAYGLRMQNAQIHTFHLPLCLHVHMHVHTDLYADVHTHTHLCMRKYIYNDDEVPWKQYTHRYTSAQPMSCPVPTCSPSTFRRQGGAPYAVCLDAC